MGVTVRKQCWVGEIREIGRGRGIEEVFVGEGPRRSLSLPIHGSEQHKASVQGLAIYFLNEGLVD